MEDTLADESGIPVIANSDDIPVHSTPIKGTKIPLPSTRHMIKALLEKGKPSTLIEQEISELPNLPEEKSILSRRAAGDTRKLTSAASQDSRKLDAKSETDKICQDLKSQGTAASVADKQTLGEQLAGDKSSEHHLHYHPRSASDSNTRFNPSSYPYNYNREDNIRSHIYSKHPRSHSASVSQRPYSPDTFDKSSKTSSRELKFEKSSNSSQDNDNKSESSQRRYERSYSPTTFSNFASRSNHELKREKTASSSRRENIQEYSKGRDMSPNSQTFKEPSSKANLESKFEMVKNQDVGCHKTHSKLDTNAYHSKQGQVKNDLPVLSKTHSPSNRNTNAFSSYAFNTREGKDLHRQSYRPELTQDNRLERQTYRQVEVMPESNMAVVEAVNDAGSPKLRVVTTAKLSDRTSESSPLARRTITDTLGEHTLGERSGAGMKSLSTSVKQVSYSEMEMSTIQKQRQEIQLLVTELKDRDRELGDMMSSHQQQLLAWDQDRQRVTSLDRKCSQYEVDLQSKTTQLHNVHRALKALKSKHAAQSEESEINRITVDRLLRENDQIKQQLAQYEDKCDMLQNTVQELSSSVGKLQAREEELNTSLKLKEKDIISATNQMRDLSDRLRQLDSRCKECQDREKEAMKERNDWKQKYDNSSTELQSLRDAMEGKSKQISQLEEELISLRHHLSVLQKDADMREKCQEELIESMRIKQERTDSQLKNFRELYDRQLQELSKIQLQLDTSKDTIIKQQSSLDEQQLSGSYSIRGNSRLSVRSPDRQRNIIVQTSRYRDTDSEVHNSQQHTQSSGYQTQVSVNQSELLESQSMAGAQLHLQPHRSHHSQEISAGPKTYNDYANFSQERFGKVEQQLSDDQAFVRTEVSPKHVRFKESVEKQPSVNEASASRPVPKIPGAIDSGTIPIAHSDPLSVLPQANPPPTVPLQNSPLRKDGYVIQQTNTESQQTGSERQNHDSERQNHDPYMFENRLCSFLEDVDDIDDNIWDDQGNISRVIPEVDGSSPASKLLNLLMESRRMIQSLEETASSPTAKQGSKSGQEKHGNQ